MESSTRRRRDEPQQLGDVLSQLFALRGYGRRQAHRQLEEQWRRLAGDTIADQTRIQGIKNGVLQIAVTNSAMLQELDGFHKWSLLQRLSSEYSDLRIRDLKFRLQGGRNH